MKFILIGLFMIAGQAFAQGPQGRDIEATSLLGAPEVSATALSRTARAPTKSRTVIRR